MFSHHERVNMAISKSGLPKTVLELFDPRQDLEYKPPIDKKPPVLPLIGLAGYVAHFPEPEDEKEQVKAEIASENREYRNKEYYCQVRIGEPTVLERRKVKAEAKKAGQVAEQEAALATYDPKSDPNAAGTDAMRTLFVSRLDYKTSETDLYSEFEKHGAIRQLKLIRNTEGKSRGYAFIEYQHSADMKKAYKAYPDGSARIGGSEWQSIVDVERGRTVEQWRPMRLGGGKGGESRLPRSKKDKKIAAPTPTAAAPRPPPPPGGGYDRDRRSGGYGEIRPARDGRQENGWKDRDRYAGAPPARDSRGHSGRAERDRNDDGYAPRERGHPRDSRVGGGDRGSNGYRDDRHRPRDDRGGYGMHHGKRERGDDRGYSNGYGGDGRGRNSFGDHDRRGGYDRERDSKRGRYDSHHRGSEQFSRDRDRGHRR